LTLQDSSNDLQFGIEGVVVITFFFRELEGQSPYRKKKFIKKRKRGSGYYIITTSSYLVHDLRLDTITGL